MTLPTIRIKHATRGWCIINESDFDPSRHEVWSEDETPPADLSGIDRMPRAKVIAALKAAGVKAPKGTIGELRADLRRLQD